ncbi:MAG: hypothetical protein RLZZ323_1329 [Bacteroidota bacterium]|jgi:hypothetical protein
MIADKLNSKIKNRVKNKSKYFILILFLLFTYIGNAQITISGKVITAENKPLDLAEVVLLTKDSVAIKSELTDGNGYFNLKANPGKYKIQIRQIGKLLFYKEIEAVRNTDLGDIIVVLNDNVLKEITVVARKKLIERKVDRLVFNVENSISAAGGDALDALKITPSIRVQNEKISLIGKSSLAVMIDDKLIQLSGDDLINFLKTISSDNIKNIEVITTPPAKYSAEGNSGLINIKLKKVKKDSWNASLNSAYKQAFYSTGSLGASLNFNKNKFTLLSSINILNGSSAPTETSKIFYPNNLWFNNSQRQDYNNSIGGRIGIDYEISRKWLVGLQYSGSYSKPNIYENNLTTISNNSNSIESYIKTDAKNFRNNNSTSINFHTIYKINTNGAKITTDLDYFSYTNDHDRTFNSKSLDLNLNTISDTYFSAKNFSKNNLINYAAKIDIEMPSKFANFSYGGKISSIENQSDVRYYNLTNGNSIYNPNQSNKFKYTEKIEALYISASKKINDKWEFQSGLRMEYTHTVGNSIIFNQKINNNYIRYFPTAYITYLNNENNSFSLNYSKRINRPSYFSFNPFRWYINPFYYSEGNPYLQPSFTDNIELSYTRNQKWENKIYLSNISNGFSQLSTLNTSTNIQAVKYDNYFNSKIFGFSESYTLNISNWLESVNTVDLNYSKTNSQVTITNPNRIGFNSFFSTNNTINLNKYKTFILNINFWLNPKGVSDLDIMGATNQLNLAIKVFLLNKKLQLTLLGNDVLSSNRSRYTSFNNNIMQEYKNYYDIRYFRLSIIYKMGSDKLKVEKRQFGNEDEKQRIN